MNWFYSLAGEQKGPVSQEQFDELVAQGIITDTMLVWRDGLADWQPWSALRPTPDPTAEVPSPTVSDATTAAPTPAGQERCRECGGVFPDDEVIRFGNDTVCSACKPVYLQRIREGIQRPGELVFASIWQRFVADFIDGLIVMVPMFALIALVGGVTAFGMVPAAGASMSMLMLQVFLQLLFYGAYVLYNTILVGRYGYTLGKKALGLKIVLADGGKVTYGRACGRAFAEILSGLACYIGYLIAFFDKEKRSLHDHICNTRVVKM